VINGTSTQHAKRIAGAGISVVPIRTDGSKRPSAPAWKQFQDRIPTEAEIEHLFGGQGIATICGAVSGNLEVIDVDAPELVEPFERLLKDLAPGLLENLNQVATPRNNHGGRQYRYRKAGPVAGNTKLAQSEPRPQFNPDGTPQIDQRTGEQRWAPVTLIETRGEGGYALAPGSPPTCHETGLPYKHIGGPDLTDLRVISDDDHSLIWRAAQSFNQLVDESNDVPSEPTEGGGLSPGTDYCERTDWADILTPAGWTVAHASGGTTYWRRPGKSKDWSATTGLRSKNGNELFCVFSSNAHPFEGPSGNSPCSTYTKFAAYAILNHGGDFTAAAKALGESGYGDQEHRTRHRGPAAELPETTDDTVTNATVERDEQGKASTHPLPMVDVLRRIRAATDNWPRSVDHALFVDDGGVHWLESTASAFGWLQSTIGTLRWHRAVGCVSREEVFAELRRTAMRYEAVEELPHEPTLPGHYYACKMPSPGDGSALAGMLDRFNPATEIDRDLMQAALATPIWGGPPGSRPCFVITSDDGRGVGKSKFAEIAGRVFGGFLAFSANEAIGEIKARLLSAEGLPKRVALLDNVKSLKLSWAELEALITATTISGKRMYVGEASRPNTICWFITLNGASLSTDMAQRCIPIKLTRPMHAGNWEEETLQFVDDNRQAIIADLVGWLRTDPKTLRKFSRWGTWEKHILARLPEPEEAQRIIADRQGAADVEAEEADVIQDYIAGQLASLDYDPADDRVLIPSAVAGSWFNRAMSSNHSVIGASRMLGQMCDEGKLQRLHRSLSRAHGRGFIWGDQTTAGRPLCVDVEERVGRRREWGSASRD